MEMSIVCTNSEGERKLLCLEYLTDRDCIVVEIRSADAYTKTEKIEISPKSLLSFSAALKREREQRF